MQIDEVKAQALTENMTRRYVFGPLQQVRHGLSQSC